MMFSPANGSGYGNRMIKEGGLFELSINDDVVAGTNKMGGAVEVEQ